MVVADDLELIVRSIEGEGPSPDFVASLRERIVAEAEMTTSAVDVDDQPVVEIDLRPQAEERTMTTTRWMLAGLAAAAIALIVGFVALSGDGDDGGLETIEPPEETTTTTTTAAPSTTAAPTTAVAPTEAPTVEDDESAGGDPTGAERRLNTALQWFDPGRDFESTFSLLTDEVEFVTAWDPSAGQDVPQPIDDFLILTAFFTARGGGEYLDLECSVIEDDGVTTTVECPHRFLTEVERAVDGPTAPSVATLTITDEGITSLGWNTVPGEGGSGLWINRFIRANYEAEAGELMRWPFSSVEDATRAGERWREILDDWVVYNDRFGCTAENWETCGPRLVVESYVIAAFTGNEEDASSLVDPDASVIVGSSGPAPVEDYSAYADAIGERQVPAGCSISGPESNRVLCDVRVSNSWSTALGADLVDLTLEFEVSDENLITEIVRSAPRASYVAEVWDPVVDWLEGNHPEDVASMIDTEGTPITTPQAIELWARYTEEFVAAQG